MVDPLVLFLQWALTQHLQDRQFVADPLSQEGEHRGGVVKLTRPDGTPIYVNPAAIAVVTADTTSSGGNSVITFAAGSKQAVLETVEEIKRIMEEERGE